MKKLNSSIIHKPDGSVAIDFRPEHSELQRIGKNDIAPRGFSKYALIQHLANHLQGRFKSAWCSMDCAAKVFNYRSNKQSRAKTRAQINCSFNPLLMLGLLLLREMNPATTAVRLFDKDTMTEDDWQLALDQLHTLEHRGELKGEALRRMKALTSIDQIEEPTAKEQNETNL
jgi:hypothetical protein